MTDYISRNCLLNAFAQAAENRFLSPTTLYMIAKEFPAADVVERKRGKWIGSELGSCSCCGHEGCASDIWNDGNICFCPYCGADLRGES